MIQMLRKEACSGAIADLSHVRTKHCLSGCLTKKSANPKNLMDAVKSGWLKELDSHPPFRSMLEHKVKEDTKEGFTLRRDPNRQP